MASLLPEIQKSLSSFVVKDLAKARPILDGAVSGVIETSSDARLRDVVSLLLSHNITSCPVRRADAKSTDGPFAEAYIGVVDLLDIVAFVLSIVKKTAKWGRGFETVLEAVVQFAEHTVQDVLDASPVAAFQFVNEKATVYEMLQLLGKDRYHRVVVVDDNKHMQNIITQSAMLNFLSSRIAQDAEFRAFAGRSLAELGMTERDIIAVPLSSKAVDAFHLIHVSRVTGVPIVDKYGSLVGNISAKDIRSMVGSPDKFDRLFDSISQFLVDIEFDRSHSTTNSNLLKTPSKKQTAPASPFAKAPVDMKIETEEKSSFVLPRAITVTSNDSLAFVIQTLVQHKIHRVYIAKGCVDDNGHIVKKTVGIVTQTDIMNVFTEGSLKTYERVSDSANRSYSN